MALRAFAIFWLKLTLGAFAKFSTHTQAPLSQEMAKAMRAAMKARKAMKKSVIAKGKRARLSVFNGTFQKTKTGLKKSDLMKNKAGRKAYLRIKGWTAAVTKARKALGVKGFLAVKKGTPLYKKAKEFYGQ